jgi:diguanylate cyclase (GGDEF)-like protein/PAS domain S-box-containing protein
MRMLARRRPTSPRARSLLAAVASFGASFGTSQLSSHVFRDPHLAASAWWPSAGVALAMLARSSRRWWPALLAGLVAGNLLTNYLAGTSALGLLTFAAANAIEATVAASLLRRPERDDAPLASPVDALRLAVGAVLGVGLAASLVALRAAVDGLEVLPASRGYAISHALGLIMVAPLLTIPRSGLGSGLADRRRNVEWAAQLAASLLLAAWVFVPDSIGDSWPFVMVVPLLWGAARLGPLRALCSVAAVAVLAVPATLHGHGSLASIADPVHRQLVLQALIAVLCLVTLAVVLSAHARDEALARALDRETALLDTQHRLHESEQRFRLAFDSASVGMFLVSLEPGRYGRITKANPAISDMLGYSAAEILEQDVWTIAAPEETAAVTAVMAELAGVEDATVRREKRYLRRTGELLWGMTSSAVVTPDDGSAPYLITVVEDVTARKAAEAALTHRALHDPLTGLPNRALLRDRIAHAVSASQRSGVPAGVMFIDLDGFKNVNDSAGHHTGDQLLVEVGHRLKAAVRPGDTVARLGGDEFAVVCTGLDAGDALDGIAERVLAGLRPPYLLDAGAFTISGSIGLAVSTPESSAEQLVHDADLAMYAAKRAGKDRIVRAGSLAAAS